MATRNKKASPKSGLDWVEEKTRLLIEKAELYNEGIVFTRQNMRILYVWGVKDTIKYKEEWIDDTSQDDQRHYFSKTIGRQEAEKLKLHISNQSYFSLRKLIERTCIKRLSEQYEIDHEKLKIALLESNEKPDVYDTGPFMLAVQQELCFPSKKSNTTINDDTKDCQNSKLRDKTTSFKENSTEKKMPEETKVKDAQFKREIITIYFKRPVQFEEGIVFENILKYVYVWGVNDEIRCDCEYPDRYSSLKMSKLERKHFNSSADRAFGDLKYSELRWLFKSRRFGGEVKSKYEKNRDIEKHMGLIQIIKEYGDLPDRYNKTTHMTDIQKTFLPGEEYKAKEYGNVVEALKDLGGSGSLWEICKVYYGNRNISTEESISVKKELDAAEEVEIDDNYVFRIVEKKSLESVKSDKANPIPDKRTEETRKRHAVISPKERILVVKTNLFTCLSKGHSIESLLVDIPVMKNGEINKVTVEIQHCRTDDKFFMFETDFLMKVYKYGRFDSRNVLRAFVYNGKDWGLRYSPMASWSPQSPLMIAGYNVNQQKNLSEKERRHILKNIIELGVLGLQDVKNYLSTFIIVLGAKPENWLAKDKWESDLQYLQNLYKGKHIGIWKDKIQYRSELLEI